MTTPTPSLLQAALAWHHAGASVIPVKADGTKAPFGPWTEYQHHRPTEEQLRAWFTSGQYDGLGIICGHVSGGIEMFEVEGRAQHLAAELAQMMDDNDLGDLWRRITGGYLETSPSGGYHWLYRVDGAPIGNTKLARRPSTPDEFAQHVAHLRADAEQDPNPDIRARRLATIDRLTPQRVPQVMIETRGEGGFTILAPSAGRTHPTGKAWTALIGSPATLPTITAEERDALHAIAATFDQMPAHEAPERENRGENIPGNMPPADGGVRPGDDYNTKATWDDILAPHGWTKNKRIGHGHGWTRPGKNPRDGISATTGQNDGDNLYVFTTSTVFEEGRPYSKFAAYTLLEHGGDYRAAAKELAAQGYGRRPERPRPAQTTADDLDGLIAPPAMSGANALQPQEAAPPRPALTVVQPATYTETDDGNALRLIDTHNGRIRYVPQRGQWLTWDGHRWRWDDNGNVRELARGIARDLPEDDKEAARHKKASLSRRGIEAMVALAQTDHRAATNIITLDARPYELNTPAGIVDLRTGKLRPADPAALHTRATTVPPDPQHPTPRWDQFLADTFAGDPDLVTYIQRLFGISLIGTVLEQLLPFAFGSGQNGKSVLFETVQNIAGIGDDGYATSVPADMFIARGRDDHPATIAQLAGVRIAVGGEIEQGARFAEARIKMLTGGDPINARYMGQNPFTFIPTHTLWLHANYQPEVKAGGPAFWRRLRQIPFIHTVPDDKKVEGLADILVADEGPGILAWIIQGAADYFTHGLHTPASVEAATAAYQHDTDTVAQFVEDMCETGNPNAQHMHVRTPVLRQAYEAWCRAEGLEPVTARALTQQLRARHGVATSRTGASRYYDGIRLLEPSHDDDEVSPRSVTEPSHDNANEGW